MDGYGEEPGSELAYWGLNLSSLTSLVSSDLGSSVTFPVPSECFVK